MKKVLAMLIALLMICSVLTACGEAPAKNAEASAEANTDPAPAPEPEPVKPDPMKPDPVEPDPVEPDPVEPDPVEPDPVEPDPVEPDPVEPTDVTMDIVAVELASTIGLTRQSSGGMPTVQGFEYDAIVVKCLTAPNEIAWLFMTPDQYRSAFNDFTFSRSTWANDASSILYTCPQQVRVHGTTCDPADYGLSAKLGNDTLIEYSSHETVYTSVTEELYKSSTLALRNVYTEIVSIDPVMTIFPTIKLYATDVLCHAETATGEEIYILMSISDYKTHIDAAAELSDRFTDWNNHADAKTFSTPLTLHGVSYEAASVISDLPSDIGCDMIFWFKSV